MPRVKIVEKNRKEKTIYGSSWADVHAKAIRYLSTIRVGNGKVVEFDTLFEKGITNASV
jgi:hypothetical protein